MTSVTRFSSRFCHHTTGWHCATSETLVVKLLCQQVSSSHDSEATSQKTWIFSITTLSHYKSHSVYHKPEMSYLQSYAVWPCPVHTLTITLNKQATYFMLYSWSEFHRYSYYTHGIVLPQSDGTYVRAPTACCQSGVPQEWGSKFRQLEGPNMPATVSCLFIINMGSCLYLSMSLHYVNRLLWPQLPCTLYATSRLWL
jgi:hypothetical protein